MQETATSLLWIVVCTVLAPLLAGLTPRRLVSEVVFLLALGVLIGPHVVGVADTTDTIELLRELGLGMLFLLAGYEIELHELTGPAGRRACATWVICLLTALAVVWLLNRYDPVHAEVAVAIALTSTALGTLLPILKDSGLSGSRLGVAVMHHGAYGELGPVVAMALLLGIRGPFSSMLVLLAFGLAAVAVSMVSTRLQREGSRLLTLIRAGAETTAQTLVRLSMLLLVALGTLAVLLDLDIVLGAFAAGIVLRQLLPVGHPTLELRLNGLAFGFFVPIFFVTSGMAIDPAAVASEPGVLTAFIVLIVVIRGGVVLASEWWGSRSTARSSRRELLATSLFAATGLPIIVAVTSAAVTSGQMDPRNASLMVAGGAVTVLVCPFAAALLLSGRHQGVNTEPPPTPPPH